MAEPPSRPPFDESSVARKSCLSLFLAGVWGGVVLLAAATLVLAILGQSLVLVPAVCLIATIMVMGLHYYVWGFWLGPMIRADVEAEERKAKGQ